MAGPDVVQNGTSGNGVAETQEHGFTTDRYALDTLLVHAGLPSNRPEGAAIYPIFQTATFGHHGPGERPTSQFNSVYTRPADNPNLRVLAAKLATLEGTEDAIVFGSGMGAISNTMMTLLRPGDHFLTQASLYGGTYALFYHQLTSLGVEFTVVDTMKPDTWKAALRPTTKVFYVESISNPLLEVGDLRAVAAFSKEHGLTSVVDSTFAPPVNFRPKAIGFDVVLHSATKYLNGHSDIIAGVACSSMAFIEKATSKLMEFGAVLDPHAAFLLQRGLATLGLRVRQQNKNGLALATFLSQHPLIDKVFYPGLPSAPGHKLAKDLFSGFGGVLAAELKGGVEAAYQFIHALHIPFIAVSLGGVESLVCVPALTTHAVLGPEGRKVRLGGIGDGLVRIALGIEDTDDVVHDFAQALEKVQASSLDDLHLTKVLN